MKGECPQCFLCPYNEFHLLETCSLLSLTWSECCIMMHWGFKFGMDPFLPSNLETTEKYQFITKVWFLKRKNLRLSVFQSHSLLLVISLSCRRSCNCWDLEKLFSPSYSSSFNSFLVKGCPLCLVRCCDVLTLVCSQISTQLLSHSLINTVGAEKEVKKLVGWDKAITVRDKADLTWENWFSLPVKIDFDV